MKEIIMIVLLIVEIYIMIGVVFSIPFHWKGLAIVDKDTVGSTLLFKILITPGIIIFWPHLLYKWKKK